MGFQQMIVLSGEIADAKRRDRVASSARQKWEFLRWPKRGDLFPDRVLFAPPEMTDNAYESDAAYELAMEQNDQLDAELAEWTSEFPDVPFAAIDVECFAGTCLYCGFICQAGKQTLSQDSTKDGHVILLRAIGLIIDDAFEPFQRGFFEK